MALQSGVGLLIQNYHSYIKSKCIRIMFGDRQAYLDKFKTCVKARKYDKQALTDDLLTIVLIPPKK